MKYLQIENKPIKIYIVMENDYPEKAFFSFDFADEYRREAIKKNKSNKEKTQYGYFKCDIMRYTIKECYIEFDNAWSIV